MSNGSKAISKLCEEDKRRRLGPEADRPHRVTYCRLTR